MWLQGEGFFLEVQFEHTHDGRRHRHDALVASIQAHALCHRLDGRKEPAAALLL